MGGGPRPSADRVPPAYRGASPPQAAASGLLGLGGRELRGRVGLQAVVGNRVTTTDRAAILPLLQSALGPVQGGQPVAQTGDDGVVGLLGGQASGGLVERPRLVGRRPVPLPGGGRLVQEVLHPGPLGIEQLPCPLVVHLSSSTRSERHSVWSVRGLPSRAGVRVGARPSESCRRASRRR